MALIKCPECGREMSTNAKACPHCGSEITICPDCEKIYAGKVEVCINCGCDMRKLESGKAEADLFDFMNSGEDTLKCDDEKKLYEKIERYEYSFKLIHYIYIGFYLLTALIYFLAIHFSFRKDDILLNFINAYSNTNWVLIIASVMYIISATFNFIWVFIYFFCCANWLTEEKIDGMQYVRKDLNYIFTKDKKGKFYAILRDTSLIVFYGVYFKEMKSAKRTIFIGLALKVLFSIVAAIIFYVSIQQNIQIALKGMLLDNYEIKDLNFVLIIVSLVVWVLNGLFTLLYLDRFRNKAFKWARNLNNVKN